MSGMHNDAQDKKISTAKTVLIGLITNARM